MSPRLVRLGRGRALRLWLGEVRVRHVRALSRAGPSSSLAFWLCLFWFSSARSAYFCQHIRELDCPGNGTGHQENNNQETKSRWAGKKFERQLHLDVFIVWKHETMISSRLRSSTTRKPMVHTLLLLLICYRRFLHLLPKYLVDFDKPVQNWYDFRPTHCLPALTLSFGTNSSVLKGTHLLFPKLTNKLIPILSFLVKVLRKPIPSIHHIKIRHYISPSIFLGLPTSRNTFYIIGKLHESLKAVSVNI